MASPEVCLLFGASGRLGLLVESRLISRGYEVIKVQRGWSDHQILEALNKGDNFKDPKKKIGFCDCSIDYTSTELFYEHERTKSKVMEHLHAAGMLGFYLGFSSGIVEFDDCLIFDAFKLAYKEQKLSRLTTLKNFGIPFFFPKIFTVIGPISYRAKSTAWVAILDKCIGGSVVDIADPLELRSWVSEEKILSSVDIFLENPNFMVEGALISGTFSLGEIVILCGNIFSKKISIRQASNKNWLGCAYINQFCDYELVDVSFKDISLERLIKKIILS